MSTISSLSELVTKANTEALEKSNMRSMLMERLGLNTRDPAVTPQSPSAGSLVSRFMRGKSERKSLLSLYQ